jgi:P4 family phage/plasmid primase-like protien
MIQVLKLRAFQKDGKEKKFDAFLEPKVSAPSVSDLFENLDSYLKQIPPVHHWNLFFTVANCTEEKREFESMSVLCFDIDHIDPEKIDDYVRVFCKTLGVEPEHTGAVFSGHGMQFFIGLQVPIVDKAFFTQHREHYRALTVQLDRALKLASLPGEPDPTVFDARRLMRLPNTQNRKTGKPDAQARLLQGVITPIPFDITQASGIPVVAGNEQIDKEAFARFPRTDTKAILAGCNFLKYAKSNPSQINEPQWYAALSITARMEDGVKQSHELSSGHPSYAPGETDLKISQALTASGPRTCSSIDNIWEGCKTCPNYGKVTSPILLLSPDTIKTEHSGFHDLVFDADTGKMKKGKPNYEDLRKFFEKQHSYVTHAKTCFIWTGTQYEEYDDTRLAAFAQTHFLPACQNFMAQEFLGIINRTNLVTTAFWETTRKKANFLNGVLDMETGTLSPHSKDTGFKATLPYNYEPQAQCPTFQKFLADVTCGSEDLQSLLIEFGGYALSGDEPWAAKMLVLEGDGRNGKSTLIKALKAVAGKGAYTALAMKLLTSVDRRAGLDGALFNICEEAPKQISDTSDLKAMAAGDEITVRRLYKEAYEFQNRAKLIFSCNALPKSTDNSHGYYDRFCIVPFNMTFDKVSRDPFIFDKIQGELAGIFNLFHAGYRSLRARRMFIESHESLAQLDQFKEVTDSAVSWFKEQVTLQPVEGGSFVTVKQLFQSYSEYVEMGLFKPVDILDYPSFQKRIIKLIPGYAVRRKTVRNERGLIGIVVPELGTNSYGI